MTSGYHAGKEQLRFLALAVWSLFYWKERPAQGRERGYVSIE